MVSRSAPRISFTGEMLRLAWRMRIPSRYWAASLQRSRADEDGLHTDAALFRRVAKCALISRTISSRSLSYRPRWLGRKQIGVDLHSLGHRDNPSFYGAKV